MLWLLTVHLLGCFPRLHPLTQPSQCAHWHRQPDMQIYSSHWCFPEKKKKAQRCGSVALLRHRAASNLLWFTVYYSPVLRKSPCLPKTQVSNIRLGGQYRPTKTPVQPTFSFIVSEWMWIMSRQWATRTFFCHFTNVFICSDRCLSFTTTAFLFHVQRLIPTVEITLLFLVLNAIKCLVKLLYTDRRGRFAGSAHLTSKWAVCGSQVWYLRPKRTPTHFSKAQNFNYNLQI